VQKKENYKRSSPIELLLLGLLIYPGGSWTFDDIEESTVILAEMHCTFLHHFLNYGSTALFQKFVTFPINFAEAKTHMAEFAVAGFPGCIGSANCTHISTKHCKEQPHNKVFQIDS
jgi:hypothetical protein